MGEIHSTDSTNHPNAADGMARKHAYITLQKGLRERFPPGAALQAWLEWLDAVYSGDVKRPPPVTVIPKDPAIPSPGRRHLS
jgi:hypothetical protein